MQIGSEQFTLKLGRREAPYELPVAFLRYESAASKEPLVHVAVDWGRIVSTNSSFMPSRPKLWESAWLLLNCYKVLHPARVVERPPDDPRSIGRVVFFVELGASYLFETGKLADRIISGATLQRVFGELRRRVLYDKPLGTEATTAELAGAALVTAEADKAADIHSRDLQSWNAANARDIVCRLLLGGEAASAVSPGNKYGFDLWNHREFRALLDTWEDKEFSNQGEIVAFIRAFIEPRRKDPEKHGELLANINLRCQLAFARMYEDVIAKGLYARPVQEKLSKRSLQYNLLAHAMQDVMLSGLVPALHPFWMQALDSGAFIGQLDRMLINGTLGAQPRFSSLWARLLLLYQSLIRTGKEREEGRRYVELQAVEEIAVPPVVRDIYVTLAEVINDDAGLELYCKNKVDGITLHELAENDPQKRSVATLSRLIAAVQKTINRAVRAGNLSPKDFRTLANIIPARDSLGDTGTVRVSQIRTAPEGESNVQALVELGRRASKETDEPAHLDDVREEDGATEEEPAETDSL